jgi:hypothetical protein
MVLSGSYLHLLLCASTVAAQSVTYELGAKEDYFAKPPQPLAPGPDEVAALYQDGFVYIAAGEVRAANIKRAHEECNGQKDEACFQKVTKAWGFGDDGDANGLSKRMVGAVASVGAVVAVGAAIGAQIGVFACLLFRSDCEYGMSIPVATPQHPWKPEPAPTMVFKAPDAEVTVVATPLPMPPPEQAPSIVNNADGSVEITIPTDLVDVVQQSIDRVICKRSSKMHRRQDPGDLRKECVKMAAEGIARESDLGAFLSRFRGLRVAENNPARPNMGIPLPAGFQGLPDELNHAVDMLSYFGPEAATARKNIAGLSLLISYARIGADIEIKEKFSIPKEKLEDGEDENQCKEPHSPGMWWCNSECGGGIEGTKPEIPYTCKGRSAEDPRKG